MTEWKTTTLRAEVEVGAATVWRDTSSVQYPYAWEVDLGPHSSLAAEGACTTQQEAQRSAGRAHRLLRDLKEQLRLLGGSPK